MLGDTYPEKVKEYYADGNKFGVKITYINQGEPKGIAHAVGLCEESVGNNSFIVYLGDNLLKGGIKNLVRKFEASDQDARASFQATNHVKNCWKHYGTVFSPHHQINFINQTLTSNIRLKHNIVYFSLFEHARAILS